MSKVPLNLGCLTVAGLSVLRARLEIFEVKIVTQKKKRKKNGFGRGVRNKDKEIEKRKEVKREC